MESISFFLKRLVTSLLTFLLFLIVTELGIILFSGPEEIVNLKFLIIPFGVLIFYFSLGMWIYSVIRIFPKLERFISNLISYLMWKAVMIVFGNY